MSRTISAQELQTLLVRRADLILLDVRREADYAADPQALPDAHWRKPEDVDQWAAALPADKEIVIYCARGGSVSNAVVDRLRARALNARFIEGGIEAWKNAGGAVVDK